MRGERQLYLPFFSEPNTTIQGRGRSDILIQNRDRKLVLRYYYHTKFKRLKYDDTIRQLIYEFDLAERTITDRLQLLNDMINEVMKDKPPVVELKREYPYYSWT
jgi:hypothetical protein